MMYKSVFTSHILIYILVENIVSCWYIKRTSCEIFPFLRLCVDLGSMVDPLSIQNRPFKRVFLISGTIDFDFTAEFCILIVMNLKGRFLMIHNSVCDLEYLDVLLSMMSHTPYGSIVYKGVGTLGFSKGKYYRAIKYFEDNGVIVRVGRGVWFINPKYFYNVGNTYFPAKRDLFNKVYNKFDGYKQAIAMELMYE